MYGEAYYGGRIQRIRQNKATILRVLSQCPNPPDKSVLLRF